MKRFTLLILFLFLFLCLSIPMANADEDPVVISIISVGDVVEAGPDQEIIIRGGWVACTKGLTQAYARNASISMEVLMEGTNSPFLVLPPPSRQFWTPAEPLDFDTSRCVMAADGAWVTEWIYPLGTLEKGNYQVHVLWTLDHPLPDGGDYDGDGRPDLLQTYVEKEFTIEVE